MILDLRKHNSDFFGQFTKNGIIIDTCVLRILIDGAVSKNFSKITSQDFEELMYFLDLIKMTNRWSQFYITPHILTETCHYVRTQYLKYKNIKEILELIFPILTAMGEFNAVNKDQVLNSIDFLKPVIEIGDISICLMTEDFTKHNKKIAFLSIDGELNSKFADNNNVLTMDFKQNIINFIG